MTDSTGSAETTSGQTTARSTHDQSPRSLGSSVSAIRDVASHLRLWLVAAVGLWFDLWSKDWAFENLIPDEGRIIIPHLMSFQRSLNTGALFGLGKGWTSVFIFASLLALGFVLYLFAHSTRDRWSLHLALACVLGGALGNLYDRTYSIAQAVTYTNPTGTFTVVGSVIQEDETGVVYGSWPEQHNPKRLPASWQPTVQDKGVVRDFVRMEPRISIPWLGWSFDVWPWVFNVADALLVVGVAVLMLNFWGERRHERADAKAEPNAADS